MTGGLISATSTITSAANITGGNILTGGLISATATITGGNLATGGTASAAGNITGGNLLTGGLISSTGTITGSSHLGSVVSVTGNITGGNVTTVGLISTSGNVAAGNILTNNFYYANGNPITLGVNYTANTAPPSGPANGWQWYNTSTDVLYEYLSDGTSQYWVDITSPAFAGGVVANVAISGSMLLNANATYDLGSTTQQVRNVYAVNYYGNGASLSGIITSVSNINNGTSNVTVNGSGGNVTVGVGGTSNVAVFSTGGAAVTGNLSVSGNLSVTGNTISVNYETATIISASGNVTGANLLTGGSLSIGGNVIGNLLPSANVTYNLGSTTQRWNDLWLANSTIYMGNAQISANATSLIFTNPAGGQTVLAGASAGVTGATVSATGNVTGGNILTGGLISATGNITGGNLTTAGILTVNSGAAATAIVNGAGNAVGNIGSSSVYFNRLFAQATTALYADLAECYLADADYEPGTVMDFGGDLEVTLSTTDSSKRVSGVVSTNPAHVMNSGLQGDHVVTVALIGRVPVKVTGVIRKGDLMVSAGNGRARACTIASPKVGTIIGKALENFDGGEGTIEIVIGKQ